MGMPQSLGAYRDVTTLEGAKQTIALGPVASQEVIKDVRHQRRRLSSIAKAPPVRNPSPLTNFIRCC